MKKPLIPLVKSGGYYPSKTLIPPVYRGNRTTSEETSGTETNIESQDTESGADRHGETTT